MRANPRRMDFCMADQMGAFWLFFTSTVSASQLRVHTLTPSATSHSMKFLGRDFRVSAWVHQLNIVSLDQFTRLVRAHGMTGSDAARLARQALLDYGRTLGGRDHESWQEAWNSLTGARQDAPGRLIIRNPKCSMCDGRGYAFTGTAISRAIGRGLPQGVCPECRGNRHVATIMMTALHA